MSGLGNTQLTVRVTLEAKAGTDKDVHPANGTCQSDKFVWAAEDIVTETNCMPARGSGGVFREVVQDVGKHGDDFSAVCSVAEQTAPTGSTSVYVVPRRYNGAGISTTKVVPLTSIMVTGDMDTRSMLQLYMIGTTPTSREDQLILYDTLTNVG